MRQSFIRRHIKANTTLWLLKSTSWRDSFELLGHAMVRTYHRPQMARYESRFTRYESNPALNMLIDDFQVIFATKWSKMGAKLS